MILQRVSGDLNFSNAHENWVPVCTFFHPINVPSQNTIIHINLLELLQTLGSSFAGLLCALPAPWCAFCLCGKEFTVVTFITKCHREARGAVLLSSHGRVGIIFQNGLVSRETCNMQHQTSVTQTSLWSLYEHIFFKTLFSWQTVLLISNHAHKLTPNPTPSRSTLMLSIWWDFGFHASVVSCSQIS